MGKSINERLRELRGSASQVEFARLFGVSQTTYSAWERGINEPSLEHIVFVAKELGVSTDWILGVSDQRSHTEDTAKDDKLASAEAEITKLKGEIAGLRYALTTISRK